MDERYEQIAQVFIEEYNQKKGTRFEFECPRKSMFSIPKYQFPAFEIYQIAFTDRKKRHPLFADLAVLLKLQKRLIIEVVEPNTRRQDIEDTEWSRLVEAIVDPIERDALGEVVCAQYLIIDGKPFGRIKISNTQTYRRNRLAKDGMLEEHQAINKKLGVKKGKDPIYQELHQLGIPVGHWFKEIWFIYNDEKGETRCLQIW